MIHGANAYAALLAASSGSVAPIAPWPYRRRRSDHVDSWRRRVGRAEPATGAWREVRALRHPGRISVPEVEPERCRDREPRAPEIARIVAPLGRTREQRTRAEVTRA